MLLQLGTEQAFSHKTLLSYFLDMVEFFGKVGEVIDHVLTAWGREKMVRWKAGMQENKLSKMVTVT